MKLTAILLFIGCLQVSAHGFAQGKITMRKVNASLEEILLEINKQTGVLYSANNETLQKAKKVDIDVKNADLGKVLGIVFEGQPLVYVLRDNVIIVKEKAASVKYTIVDERTPIDVKGKVTDEKGNPIAGVTVTIKGTNKQTLTDENGEFSLASIDKEAVLVFTSVNMETFEVKVNGQAELAVRLKTKVREMSEVTVTVNTGYQEISKERATGSFVKIDDELINRSTSTDILTRLKGITSGLLFDNTASNPLNISIRGRSTIFANATPLVVLDNFPYDGDIKNINPNDIESITILKDAAAASIWGALSGNGVIVITTKKGKLNQPLRISLNSNITISNKPDLYYDKRFLNSSDFIDLEKRLFDQGFYSADILNANGNFQPLSPVVEILNKRKNGLLTEAETESQINAFREFDIRNDLEKYFYRKGLNQQYAINLNGGGSNGTYFFSAGFDNNRPNQVGSKFDRITVNSLNSFKPIANLELIAGINFIQFTSQTDNTLSQILTGGSNSKLIYPYARLVDEEGTPLSFIKDYSMGYIQAAPSKGFLNWQFYPLEELRQNWNNNQLKNYDIRLTGGVKYTILRELTAEFKYQFEKGISDGVNTANRNSYFARNMVNQYSVVSSGKVSGYNIPKGGVVDYLNTNFLSQNLRGALNFTKNLDKHSIVAIAGIDIREVKSKNNTSRIYGYDENIASSQTVNYTTFFNLNPSGFSSIFFNNTINGGIDRFRSFFANASYTYNSKYIITASGRVDQSNLFGVKTNQKSIPLWSTGVRWDASKENFYNLNFLPMLRLRATYGANGNVNKSITAYNTLRYSSSTDLTGTAYTYATVSTVGNPELRWEQIHMLNVGLDFSLNKNILSGSVEYFYKNGKDIIGDAALPSSTGFTTIRGNFSNIKGNGVDIVLNSLNVNKTFKWNTSILLSFAKDKVTKYSGVTSSIQIVEGRPINSIYSYKWGGLNPVNGNPQGYLGDTLSENYGVMVTTLAKDMIFNGSAQPTCFGNVLNSINWKQFSLSFNVTYKLGYYFRRSGLYYGNLFNSWAGHIDYASRWQKPGDESITSVPSVPASVNLSRDIFYTQSEPLVSKGDHIRLQDISLEYNLNKRFIKKLPMRNIRVYIYITNLGIIWKENNDDIDPDFQTGFPNPRSVSFGTTVDF